MYRFLALAMLAALVLGQEEKKEEAKPKPVELDELSKKLLDDWDKKVYSASKAGVKKASCTIKATVGAMKGSAPYKWDGKKGSLAWDNAQLGATLAQQGWSVQAINERMKAEPYRKAFEGCKLTAKAEEDQTRIKIEGHKNITEYVFTKEGVFKGLTLEMANPMGGKTKLVLDMPQKKEGDHYVEAGWTLQVDTPMGKFMDKTTVTYGKVGDFLVITKAVSEQTMGGNPSGSKVIEFTDWKFNDDVK